jgi:hypothetical protein
MSRVLASTVLAVVSVCAATAEEPADTPAYKGKFGIFMPTTDAALHPGWRHPNKPLPKESDWAIATETAKLPLFFANTGMLWGFEIEGAPRACETSPKVILIAETYPDDPEMFLNAPPHTYDRKTRTRETMEVMEGCHYRHSVLFTPGDPVGRHKIAVWITRVEDLKVGLNIKRDLQPDVVFEFDVYQPATGEVAPSAFAHCNGKWGDYDPKIADCKPRANGMGVR